MKITDNGFQIVYNGKSAIVYHSSLNSRYFKDMKKDMFLSLPLWLNSFDMGDMPERKNPIADFLESLGFREVK